MVETTPTQSNFAFAFLLLPAKKREALKAVYGFCRAVDDAVDEVKEQQEGLVILAQWREQLRLIYEGHPTSELGQGLQAAVSSFALRRADLEDILLGVEMDLVHQRYDTFADLYRYCYRVASAVGMVAMEIFGQPEKDGRLYAERLGLALQLTNIIRDVAEDAERGRIYLPLEDLRRFSVTEAEIMAGHYSDRFVDLMSFQAGRAHRYFELARTTLPARARRRLGAAEAMGGIYFQLLRDLEAQEFRVFNGRIRVATKDKVSIAARCLVKQALS